MKSMAEFPCSLERTVASALLLLSTTPPPPPPPSSSPKFVSEDECSFEEKIEGKCSREITTIGDSKSCSSTLTREESSGTQVQGTSVSTLAFCNELNLNVVRKSRSKLIRISENMNITSGDEVTLSSGSVSSETSSLSSSSSVITSAPSRCLVTKAEKKLAMIRHVWRKKHVASAHMRRRAEAILSYLSGGCSSEVKIRQVLGDSPDTSKALRMLLKLEEIKRSGTGGRQDPYIYMIA